jgi:hypothetical protein
VKPLIFDNTPMGSRHEQRKKKDGATKIKRREASGEHPALAELHEPDSASGSGYDDHDSAAPDDDLGPEEDQPPGTAQKESSAEGFSLNELLWR